MIVSPKIFEDLRFALLSNDYDKFHNSPLDTLNDEQRAILCSLVELKQMYGILSEKEINILKQDFHKS